MEEERIVVSFGKTGKICLDFIIKSLDVFASKVLSAVSDAIYNRQLSGETSWNKLMKSPEKIGIQELMNTEVNLDKLKEELGKYGIAFAFYQQPNSDKVHMAYAMRHEDVVKQAYADVIKEITENPKSFMNTVKKEPHEQKIDEKLKYYKAQEQSEVKQASMKKQATTPKTEVKSAFDEIFSKFSEPGGKSL